jgi:hypothetical protein
MDLCRQDYIYFTGWVGLDKLLNSIFSIHIAIISLAAIIVFWLLLMKIDTSLGQLLDHKLGQLKEKGLPTAR